MDRRTLIASLGATGSIAIAGCVGGLNGFRDSWLPLASDDGSSSSPGIGALEAASSVSATDVTLLVTDAELVRQRSLQLYLDAPTPSDPAEGWEIEKEVVARPTLDLPSADGPLEAEIVDEQRVEGETADFAKITFELNEELPEGVPLQFALKTTGDVDDETYSLGTTQPFTLVPGEDETLSVQRSSSGYEPLRHSDESPVFFGQEKTDDGYRVRMATGTNDTRHHAPSHDGIPNRNDDIGYDRYELGAFERPWGIEYEITDKEYDAALRHWENHYKHTGSDEDQLAPAWRYYLDGGEEWGIPHDTLTPIERLAETFAEKATLLGLETPEEKLRFVADVVQWMPYETDDERKWQGIPEVQHPVNFFARGRGDCIDKVIAATSILYQDPFPEYVMDKYYIFRNPSAGNLFQSRTEHIGLTIKSDIFTTDLGGPQVDDGDGYTYVEITYPAPLTRTASGNRELELEDISDEWPGY
ncbi:hypothetical protein [Natronobacterium gregoryi]|uniref:Uncharacterized protein n=2 Tax=Natronobacterium gregoryi TaxID=44930 RepID=L0AE46_NATGS|nr:hypothetical protein [Natronobacterium gregoryi]AFZ71335.1 hypothetical protein Natgr_0066 [Natronobacterium gregoryi SP2]ELY67037.1 hypothetical protein C490_11481 [Natronobacterium gregoryi SP2]PLK18458.1 hypothetical protein CYV19_17815 [Natronobacterium gregoryi SP2]SFJ70540.1 hypothetical protein SAMN05443661_16111 [Natronobacterium gregoryi]